MSAWVVNVEHIDALVALGLTRLPGNHSPMSWRDKDGGRRILTVETATETGRMLLAENIRSVRHRYPDDGPDDLPGPVPTPKPEEYTYSEARARESGRFPTLVEGLKLISCFDYQSCETPDWGKSEAFRFCETLEGRLICALPGYEEAPWGWPD